MRFLNRRRKRRGWDFMRAISERMDDLRMEYREPSGIKVSRLAMRGVVSYDDASVLYVHPDDWADVEAVAEDFPEGGPFSQRWGLSVERARG